MIAEFDFVHTGGKTFDNRTDLTAQKPMVLAIFEQSYHREQFEFAHRVPQSL